MSVGRILTLALVATASLLVAPRSGAVDVWVTTGDKSQLLRQNADIVFQPGTGSGGTPIQVIPATTYQTIKGFGAAVTDSSAWLLQNRLAAPARDKLLRQLFSPTAGIGINYIRVPMGASDFTASGFYTYNDNPAGGSDDQQTHFSIAHDTAYVIPQLQQARAINPDLKLMGSPWSAPAWMKTNNSLQGGALKTQWEASYARYLAKFVQAYEAQGLPIDAITLQNEPLHTDSYPTMSMSATQQANLIKNNVGPLFASENIDAKIVAYDHNWDNTAYPLAVLGDPAANPYVAGTAFHAYGGAVSAQTTVHSAYPTKDIYFTEITGTFSSNQFDENLVWNFQNIFIGATRNWATTALLWNLALDQNGSPHQNGCPDCRGVVTVNNPTGEITFNEEFYSIGQMTKAVQPGAVRIQSTTGGSLNTVAFKNPDGSRVLVALNSATSATTMRTIESGKNFAFSIPAKSVATFLWNNAAKDFDNGAFDDGGYQQGGGSLDVWTAFGNTQANVSASAEAVLSGDRSLKLAGQFSGASNESGVFQGISAAGGDLLGVDLSALVRSASALAGTDNEAHVKIQFFSEYNSGGLTGLLGQSSTTIADATTAENEWLARHWTAWAPAGTVEARLVLDFLQPANESGAAFVDNVDFRVVGAPGSPGDFNRDGAVDSADLDVWKASVGRPGVLEADADADGDVDGDDFLAWQQNLGWTQPPPGVAQVAEPSAGVTAGAAGVVLALSRRSLRAAKKTPTAQCEPVGAARPASCRRGFWLR